MIYVLFVGKFIFKIWMKINSQWEYGQLEFRNKYFYIIIGQQEIFDIPQ